MAVEKSYARLGLFIVVGLGVILATTLFFVQRMRSRAVISLVTYTTENVSGLDISSPVRFRGVPVGRISDLRVDPVGKNIEIGFEVFQDRLVSIGASVTNLKEMANLAPRLRARIIGNPVTGEAYLLIDAPTNPPPPVALGFTPTRPYVASMPSPIAVIQDRLPAVLERAELTLETLRDIIGKLPGTLDRSNQFFATIERIVRDTHLPELSADSRTFFTDTSAQIAKVTADMDRLVASGGAFDTFAKEANDAVKAADLPGSTQSARIALEQVSLAAADVRRALPEIRDSLEQLRELARRLEEQPESVVYGPRPPQESKR